MKKRGDLDVEAAVKFIFYALTVAFILAVLYLLATKGSGGIEYFKSLVGWS